MRAITVRNWVAAFVTLAALAFGLFGIGAPTGVAAASRELFSATSVQPYCDGETPVGAQLQYNNPALGFGIGVDSSAYSIPGGGAITLIATLNDPVNDTFSVIGGSWVINGDGTASLTETFPPLSCDAAPLVRLFDATQVYPECDGTTAIAPDIFYNFGPSEATFSGPTGSWDAANGGTLTYTASIPAGYEFDLTGTQWVDQGNGTATWSFTFEGIDCTPNAVPIPVTVYDPTCADGVISIPNPVYLIPSQPGVTVTASIADDDGANGQDITFTYTLEAGYSWPDSGVPEWLTPIDATSASYVYDYPFTQCSSLGSVQPYDTSCDAGVLIAPDLAYSDATGYEIVLTGSAAPGETATLTATPLSSAVQPLGTVPSGWSGPNGDGVYTYSFTFADPQCTSLPVMPDIDFECSGGVLYTPSLTYDAAEGYTISEAGEIEPGGTLTLTASPLSSDIQPLATVPAGWTESDGVYTFTYTFSDPQCTTLPEITYTDAICDTENAGVRIAPTLTLTGNPAGYSLNQNAIVGPGGIGAGGTVTITATPVSPDIEPLVAEDIDSDWGEPDANGVYTFTYTFDAPQCSAVPEPEFTDASCDAGVLTLPTFTYDAEAAIGYTITQTGAIEPGGTVTLTATPLSDDVQALGGENREGWNGPDEAGVYIFTYTFADPQCSTLPAVTIVDTSCQAGVVVDPSFTWNGEDAEGFNLTFEGTVAPGNTVTLTATPLSADVQDLADVPDGWEGPDEAGVYSVEYTFDDPQCSSLPVVTVTDTTCDDGVQIAPSIAWTPEGTAGFSFEQNAIVGPGGLGAGSTVTIDATPTSEAVQDLDTVPAGWVGPDEAGGYSFSYTFADPQCAFVPAPVVIDTTCDGLGAQIPPSFSWSEKEAIGYSVVQSGTVAPGGTVTLTATPTSDGVASPVPLPFGWSATEGGILTYTFTFADPDCALPTVPPADPAVTQASCDGETVILPTVVPATTANMTYTINGTVAPGETVNVIATPNTGYRLVDVLPVGWQFAGEGTARFEIVLDDVECVLPVATPEKPIIVDASCNGPVQTAPEITLVSTDGLEYELDDPTAEGAVAAAAIPGGTITVYAYLQDGWAFPDVLPDGWTLVDDTTAAFTFTFANPVCEEEPNVVPNPPGSGTGNPEDPDGDDGGDDGNGSSDGGNDDGGTGSGVDPDDVTSLPSTGSGTGANTTAIAALIAAMSVLALGSAIHSRRR